MDQGTPATPGVGLAPREVIAKHRAQLTALPLFAGTPFTTLEPLLLRCEYRYLAHGSVLLSSGQANHHLYLLLSGRLTIHLESLESERGFVVEPGEFVGEVSIIDSLAPTASVSAAGDCLVVGIPETLLWSDFLLVPGIARNLLRQIAARLRSRNAAMQKTLEQSLRLEYLEKELRIARDLQVGMLPMRPLFPGIPEIEVEGLMVPAREVGGDFFDAFSVDADHICVAIGDVAGKGIPAALFMMRSITLLRTEMLNSQDILRTIETLNVQLSRDNPLCMFVTLMICLIDLRRGRLHYANGGHNRPLFGNAEQGFQYLEQPKGILAGIDPSAVYATATRELREGDMLILYTDGINEAENTVEAQFTEPRLLEVVNSHRAETAGAMVERVCDAVTEFVGGAEPSDDLTMVAVRYLGSSHKVAPT
jgi:sigma-B regulation protein RsbU (phosphoserine phosphatase)